MPSRRTKEKRKKKPRKAKEGGEEEKPKVKVQTVVPSVHAGFSEYFEPGIEGGEVLDL